MIINPLVSETRLFKIQRRPQISSDPLIVGLDEDGDIFMTVEGIDRLFVDVVTAKALIEVLQELIK